MVEFIGFLISVIALIFLFFRGRSLEKYRKEHPEAFGYDTEEEKILRQVYKTMTHQEDEEEEEEVEILPIPPKKMRYDEKPLSKIEDRHLTTNIEKRKLKSEVEARRLKDNVVGRELATRLSHDKTIHLQGLPKPTEPRIAQMLTGMPHLRDMVIYQTIIGKPKGLE